MVREIDIGTGVVSTLASGLDGPVGIWYYAAGNILYETDAATGAIRTIDMGGTVTTLLTNQPSGNEWPVDIVRYADKLYVADQGLNSIWQIDAIAPTTVTIFAGNNDPEGGWNNGTGTSAYFLFPSAFSLSGDNLYVADYGNNEIRKIYLPTASVTTYAGSHLRAGTRDGLLSSMLLYGPQGVSFVSPTMIIAESGNKIIRKVQSSSSSTIAGTAPGSAIGIGSAARFYVPRQLTTDGSSVWIVDGFNHVIRSLDPATKNVGTLAGVVQANQDVIDEADGSAEDAHFAYPSGATQVGSLVFICDNVANTIRKLDLITRWVTTFAGFPFDAGYTDGIGTLARFYGPTSITNDGTYLYVTDFSNNTIRKIEIANANVTTIAGSPPPTLPGDTDQSNPPGGIASNARFRFPFGITTDGTSLFITDRSNNKIRRIDIATGSVSTFAGPAQGSRKSGYKNATGNLAEFRSPRGITTDGTYLYVADSTNHVIRKISIATAAVSTIAGSDAPTVMAGEVDGLGTEARFNTPNGITTDGTSLFVSDIYGNTIRRIR
jgi:hypothetical protein